MRSGGGKELSARWLIPSGMRNDSVVVPVAVIGSVSVMGVVVVSTLVMKTVTGLGKMERTSISSAKTSTAGSTSCVPVSSPNRSSVTRTSSVVNVSTMGSGPNKVTRTVC